MGAWGQMHAYSARLVERIQITHFQGPTARGLSDAAAHVCVKMKACQPPFLTDFVFA